jgi:hypothetical protein
MPAVLVVATLAGIPDHLGLGLQTLEVTGVRQLQQLWCFGGKAIQCCGKSGCVAPDLRLRGGLDACLRARALWKPVSLVGREIADLLCGLLDLGDVRSRALQLVAHRLECATQILEVRLPVGDGLLHLTRGPRSRHQRAAYGRA